MIATIGTALRFTEGERSTAEGDRRRTLVVQTGAQTCGYDARPRGISSSVERQLPKLERWVRFPYPALRKPGPLPGFRASGPAAPQRSAGEDRLGDPVGAAVLDGRQPQRRSLPREPVRAA